MRDKVVTLPVTAALLLASASLMAQQAAPSQSPADAKKHPAAVKYQSIPVQRTEQNPQKPPPTQPTAETAKRKDGAIVAADFNKRQSGAPLKGVGTASHAEPNAGVGKSTSNAGTPAKAATTNKNVQGAPIKGAIFK
jgi:hypothetical protein